MPVAICLVENLRNQRRLHGGNEWESGNWDVAADKAMSLIGKRIYFHERQVEPSYFGGMISAFRVLSDDHPQHPGRVVFTFVPDGDGRGFRTDASGWRNEQKTIA